MTASNQTVANGASIAASSLFWASDPDGDALTQYAFDFKTVNANSGHFVVNGVMQAPSLIHLTAAQLAQTTYQAGTGTSDDILVNAFDGAAWGAAPAEFVISTPANLRPAVTASNQTIGNGASIAASSLFSASDPDGDALTQCAFDFKTVNANSGHFVVNGVVQALGLIHLTPAQLAQTTYQGGVGTSDDFLAKALYGTAWGATPAESLINSTLSATIGAGQTLELGSAYSGTVTFTANTGTLKLDTSSSFTSTVSGLTGQDTLDLLDINFATLQQPSFSGTSSGGTLTVTDGLHTAVIALSGNYLSSPFVPSIDGRGGSLIVDPPLGGPVAANDSATDTGGSHGGKVAVREPVQADGVVPEHLALAFGEH